MRLGTRRIFGGIARERATAPATKDNFATYILLCIEKGCPEGQP